MPRVHIFCMMMIVVLAGFMILTAIKIIPIYMDNLTVSSSLTSLATAARGKGYGDRELVDLLGKRFQINDVESVDPQDLKIENSGGVVLMTLDYEVRKSMFGNIDVLVSFYESVEIDSN